MKALAAALTGILAATPALSGTISRAYTRFDVDTCRYSKGRGVEEYGSWRCPGHDRIDVYLTAGDQRMTVSFGKNAAREPAASQTLPRFNSVYRGTVEWRIESPPGGTARPFAAILRWNVKLEDDGKETTGRVLVVTRLGPDGVCHIGYVDARANPNANELAARLADEHARAFKCGADKPVVVGKVMPGLYLPKGDQLR